MSECRHVWRHLTRMRVKSPPLNTWEAILSLSAACTFTDQCERSAVVCRGVYVFNEQSEYEYGPRSSYPKTGPSVSRCRGTSLCRPQGKYLFMVIEYFDTRAVVFVYISLCCELHLVYDPQCASWSGQRSHIHQDHGQFSSSWEAR